MLNSNGRNVLSKKTKMCKTLVCPSKQIFSLSVCWCWRNLYFYKSKPFPRSFRTTLLRKVWTFIHMSGFPHRMGSSDSSLSYWSRNVLARKKMTPEATKRNPATEAMAMPTTSGSDTYSSQCSPRYHQFSPTRHLRWQLKFVNEDLYLETVQWQKTYSFGWLQIAKRGIV